PKIGETLVPFFFFLAFTAGSVAHTQQFLPNVLGRVLYVLHRFSYACARRLIAADRLKNVFANVIHNLLKFDVLLHGHLPIAAGHIAAIQASNADFRTTPISSAAAGPIAVPQRVGRILRVSSVPEKSAAATRSTAIYLDDGASGR